MKKLPLPQVQKKALGLSLRVEDTVARLESLVDALPVDVDAVSEAEATWEECPSLEFHVHGVLSFASASLQEAREHLREAAAATSEDVRRQWLDVKSRR